MASNALVRRHWNISWQQAQDQISEGAAVTLWIAVLDRDGTLLGAGPCTGTPAWEWREGRLTCSYGPVTMDIMRPGRTDAGVIVAVDETSGRYAPVLPFSIDCPEPVRPGMTLHVLDGRIGLTRIEAYRRANGE